MRILAALGLVLLLMGAAPVSSSEPPPAPPERVSPAELLLRLRTLEAEILELQQSWGEVPTTGETQATLEALAARVAAVEAEVRSLREEVEANRQDVEEAWATLDAEAEAEQRRSHVTVYGTLLFDNFEGEDSRFDAEAFELVLSGRPHDRLGFFAEIEFERAASVGGEREGEVLVEQAYASYRLFQWMDFRAGVVLVPFGNVGIDHYAPNRETISKPLVSYLLAPSDWTDNGVGFTGSFGLRGTWLVSYEAYLVAGLDDAISAAGTRAARQPFGKDNNNDKALATRWSLQRGSGLHVGASYYRGKYDDASEYLLQGWAADFQWVKGPLTLAGEWDSFDVERPTGPDGRFEGYYGRGIYRLPDSWWAHGWHGESFPDARVSAVFQYDDVTLDDPYTLPELENRERRTTFGLTYRPTHQWVLKVQHERTRGDGEPLTRGDAEGWLASVGFVF